MPPDPSKVAEIAEGLSRAQRRAMTRHYRNGEPSALYPGDPQISTFGVLVRRGLLAGAPYSRNQRFTPLGEAIRQYLATPNKRTERLPDAN